MPIFPKNASKNAINQRTPHCLARNLYQADPGTIAISNTHHQHAKFHRTSLSENEPRYQARSRSRPSTKWPAPLQGTYCLHDYPAKGGHPTDAYYLLVLSPLKPVASAHCAAKHTYVRGGRLCRQQRHANKNMQCLVYYCLLLPIQIAPLNPLGIQPASEPSTLYKTPPCARTTNVWSPKCNKSKSHE